jgi:hypothetical protein
LLKALEQPGNSQAYGFSPVWDLRCVFRFSRREYALLQFSNCAAKKELPLARNKSHETVGSARVARWLIFLPKIAIWEYFGEPWNRKY